MTGPRPLPRRSRTARSAATTGLLALLATVLLPLLLESSAASAATLPPAISVADAWVVEPAGGRTVTVSVEVRLTGSAVGGESVRWSTAAGSAGSGDFVPASGLVSFAAGETTRVVPVTVTGDDRPEANETFRVDLTAATGAVIEDAAALVTVASDEGPRRLAVGEASVLEGPAGSTRALAFPVTVSSPVLPGETVSVRFATANGTAVAGSDFNGRSGTLSLPAGSSSAAVSVVVRGDATAEPAERLQLRLSAPVGAVLSDTAATGTIRNDDGATTAAPAPGLSVDDAWAVEAGPGATTPLAFQVSLPAAHTRPVSAAWTTTVASTPGSAAPADLQTGSGTVSIPAGALTATISVPVVGDGTSEGNETVRITLSAPSGVVLADTSALGTVADDEGPLVVRAANVLVDEGTSAPTDLAVRLDLSAPVAPGQSVSVTYTTANGTATAGSDYLRSAGSVSIPAGATSATVPVRILGDAVAEPDERFLLRLTAATGATIGDAAADVVVADDDEPAQTTSTSVAFAGAAAREGASASAQVAVSLSRAPASPLVLSWSTRDGTASATSDYVPQQDVPVTVPAGATEVRLDVPLLDDDLAEATETFYVSVTAPAGAGVVGPDAMVTLLDDETPAAGASSTVVAAGDIACAPSSPSFNNGQGVDKACRQKATSDAALTVRPDAVFGLGDLQYESGELSNFRQSYDPSWGRMRDVTYPAPGNHEYYTTGATGYYGYFVATDGGTVDPWYSFDLDGWRVIALNSNCGSVGGCGPGSPQDNWLRAQLAERPAQCTVAFLHHPRWSTGTHGDDPAFDTFWRALTAAGADLVLASHDHSYERFAPMDAFGRSSAFGVREFVSGLGGKSITGFPRTPRAASEFRSASQFGILALTLRPGGYDWRTVPIAGGTAPRDSGSASCH